MGLQHISILYPSASREPLQQEEDGLRLRGFGDTFTDKLELMKGITFMHIRRGKEKVTVW